MADLTNILGGAWSPPQEKQLDAPDVQFKDAMIAAGITPPGHIEADGRIHRFKSGTKGKAGHDKSGFYVFYGDGVPSGHFGDWRSGVQMNFRADIGRKLSPSEEMAITRRMAEAKSLREAEQKRANESAADTVSQIWTDGMGASPDHPYLARKGIASHGARVTGDGRLMVPLFNQDGELSSLQYISADGDKKYHPSGVTKACFWSVGSASETIYIAEGYATAATIHEVTGKMCAIAYSAGNLPATAQAMREIYPNADLVVVADNDESGTGRNYAEQACAKTGARFVMPPMQGDANDYHQAGNDLASLLTPADDEWLVKADDFCQEPQPIKWLLKGWLQENSLIMIHGPSGGGKTFMLMEWLLTLAAGKDQWHGMRAKPSEIVYLAGEGHQGLRGRVAAWKDARQVKKLNMWLSKGGCDLNTPAGYQQVVRHIRSLDIKPAIIAVDTLHRFLQGDENSAQDAKTMLDACSQLMTEFNCSVVLVHHTGVSDEAQHRARGSSAWRGALDIEISVIPSKDNMPMEIIQRKSKDAELSQNIYCELKRHIIPNWFDEDGEPVSSAIIELAEAPEKQNKKPNKLQGFIKTFERAWWHGGAEVRDGLPYVSRSAMKDMLAKDGTPDRTVRNRLDPSRDGDLINSLVNGEVVATYEHGWIMVDEVQSSAMLMAK